MKHKSRRIKASGFATESKWLKKTGKGPEKLQKYADCYGTKFCKALTALITVEADLEKLDVSTWKYICEEITDQLRSSGGKKALNKS